LGRRFASETRWHRASRNMPSWSKREAKPKKTPWHRSSTATKASRAPGPGSGIGGGRGRRRQGEKKGRPKKSGEPFEQHFPTHRGMQRRTTRAPLRKKGNGGRREKRSGQKRGSQAKRKPLVSGRAVQRRYLEREENRKRKKKKSLQQQETRSPVKLQRK